MKILQFSAVEFTFDKFILPLALELKNQGHNVYVSYNAEKKENTLANKYGFIFLHNPIKRTSSPLNIIVSAISLIIKCREAEIDLIHCHTPIASIVARLASIFLFKCKIIYTVHGFYFHDRMVFYKYYLYSSLEYILAKLTDKLFFVSYEDYKYALKYKYKKKQSLHLIPNGVDEERFKRNSAFFETKLDNSIEEKNKSITIGIAARFVEEKGFKELIQAFFILSPKYPEINLVICGSRLTSDYNSDISSLICHLKKIFHTKITILGELASSEMPKFYKSIDIFVLPSWREGLPMTILEAMMSKLPIVASNIRGCREAVIDKYNGLLFEPQETKELIKCLETLIVDQEARRIYGIHSEERAKKLYLLSDNIKKQLKVFENIIC